MININELRRLAQAVQGSPRNFHERVNTIHKLHDALPSGVVLELLNRLEAAESDALEQARLNGMGSEREAALMAKLEAAERERDALRAEVESWKGLAAQFSKEADKAKTHLAFAKDELNHLRTKVEAMERQEPVAWMSSRNGFIVKDNKNHDYNLPLYLSPGAQPTPSVRSAALYPVISWLRNGCDPMKAADELEILAAAQEAKS